jgi:hypothetical protein
MRIGQVMLLAERTRQRQGRDFTSVLDHLKSAEVSIEKNYIMAGDGVIINSPCSIDEAFKKSLLIQLDEAKDTVAEQDTERSEPIDGHEPPERRGLVRQ